MPFITFTSPKGGCGRTTSAWLVCNELAARGHKVVYLPLDDTGIVRDLLLEGSVEGAIDAPSLRRIFRDTNLALAIARFEPHFGYIDQLAPWLREIRRVKGFLIVDGFQGEVSDFNEIPLLSDLTLLCVGASRLDALYARRFRQAMVEQAFDEQLSTFNARYLLCNTRGVMLPDGQEYLGLPKSEFMDQVIQHEPILGDLLAKGFVLDHFIEPGPEMARVKAVAGRLTDQILALVEGVDNVLYAAGHRAFQGIEQALSGEEKKTIVAKVDAF